MKTVTDWARLKARLQEEPVCAVFLSGADCNVCRADAPKVACITEAAGIPAWEVPAEKARAICGQLQVFSFPAVLLFCHGREVWRSVRFIDFTAFTRMLTKMKE